MSRSDKSKAVEENTQGGDPGSQPEKGDVILHQKVGQETGTETQKDDTILHRDPTLRGTDAGRDARPPKAKAKPSPAPARQSWVGGSPGVSRSASAEADLVGEVSSTVPAQVRWPYSDYTEGSLGTVISSLSQKISHVSQGYGTLKGWEAVKGAFESALDLVTLHEDLDADEKLQVNIAVDRSHVAVRITHTKVRLPAGCVSYAEYEILTADQLQRNITEDADRIRRQH